MDWAQRRINRIRQVHGTLALAGSSLTEAQVAAMYDQMQAEKYASEATKGKKVAKERADAPISGANVPRKKGDGE